MKGLKKFIAVSFVAVAVLGLATTASAKKPKALKTVTVQLFRKNAAAGNDSWFVDKATALIPIKNLKWNAKITEISTNNSKASICPRETGAYHLNVCGGKYVRPGDKTKVAFLIRQDGEYYVQKVTLNFVKAVSPMATLNFEGKVTVNGTDYTFTKTMANEFAGQVEYDYTPQVGCDAFRLTAVVAAPQTAVKIVGGLKCGKEVKLYNTNWYELKNFCYIKVIYKTTKDNANAAYFKNYFKAENDSFKGTKRFPAEKYCIINIK